MKENSELKPSEPPFTIKLGHDDPFSNSQIVSKNGATQEASPTHVLLWCILQRLDEQAEQHSQGRKDFGSCSICGVVHEGICKPKDQPCDVKSDKHKDPGDEVSKLANKVKELECVTDAWHTAFGTSQLTHALARLEQAENDAKRKSSLVALDESTLLTFIWQVRDLDWKLVEQYTHTFCQRFGTPASTNFPSVKEIIFCIRQYFTDRGEMPLETITTIKYPDIVNISKKILKMLKER